MIKNFDDTIIALASPIGKGAIALIRLSGQDVREIVSKISFLPNNKNIKFVKSSTVHFGFIVDNNKSKIDQVMFIVLDGPRTFTGQNTIEITCHNNQFLIEKIIELAIQNGARLALEGEFTKRAYLNNKIDLIQAEAINELIHANNQLSIKNSLEQIEGSLSSFIKNIETNLIKVLSLAQASFEFLDEDIDFKQQIKDNLALVLDNITKLKNNFNIAQQIRSGIKVVLIGSVNTGKSSLFNALLNQSRSIVTDIEGTTRDTIDASLYHNGNYITITDTAGLRQTDDFIEQEGIKKSFEQAELADIILLIFDGSRNLSIKEQEIYGNLIEKYYKKIIFVANKLDLFANKLLEESIFAKYTIIKISALTKENFDLLIKSIDNKISELFSVIESPYLLNKRHYNNLIKLELQIRDIINIFDNFENFIPYELVCHNLKDAIETIGQLTGKSVDEMTLDMVFKEFCVGK